MLNKKRMTIVIGIGIIVIVAIITGVIWLASATTQGAEPSPTPSETSTDNLRAPGFTEELKGTAVTAAVTAAVFQGSDTRAAREKRYASSGFTQELAENFEPVWFDVFGTASKHYIEATGETLIGAAVNYTGVNTVQHVTATGKAGNRVYRVAVDVGCTPQWSVDGGGSQMATAFTATWTVTVDEATGLVTGIEQPTPDEIPFQPEN